MPHLLFILILLLTACNSGGGSDNSSAQDQSSAAAAMGGDSATIRLSLVPGAACLPFYVADALHLDDSLGTPIHISTYLSGADADTALMGRTVIAGYSDIDRAQYHTRRGDWRGLRAMWQCDEAYQLIVSPKTRIRAIPHLKGRLIATERFAVTDHWIHEALKAGGVAYDKTYHPQIGDLALRTSMVLAGQVDAVMLPSPYAEWAVSQGCRSIWTSPKGADRGAFYTRGTKAQADALHRLYTRAAVLTQHPDTVTRRCLDSIYNHIYCRKAVCP